MTTKNNMKLVLDLDNCMYRRSSGIAHQMGENIEAWGVNELGLSPSDASETSSWGYHTHGLALAGYVLKAGMDTMLGYLDYIHFNKMEHSKKIEKDDVLVDGVRRVTRTTSVYILTNGTKKHAKACLGALGFSEADFVDKELISCHEQWGLPAGHAAPPPEWINKPSQAAYRTTENILFSRPRDPVCEGVLFCDDSYPNLKEPHNMGWVTVWVCESLEIEDDSDAAKGYLSSPPDRSYATYVVGNIRSIFKIPEVARMMEKEG